MGQTRSPTGSKHLPMGSELLPQTRWTWVRTVVNWANLSTPLGPFIAWIGGADIRARGRGTYLASGYRWHFTAASAFTIGSVITSKHNRDWLQDRPMLLGHEDRHCTQYAFCIGVVMLPLYFITVGVSWLLAGNHFAYNPFERLANLADGGYPKPVSRLAKARLAHRHTES